MLNIRWASGAELAAVKPELFEELCSEGLPPVTALKKHLQTFCGYPRFRQRILWQGGIVREEDALDTLSDLQLVILSFSATSPGEVGALIGAAALGRLEELEELLQRPLDPNLAGGHGFTALHASAHGGQVRATSLLLEALAAVDQAGPDQTTPLFMAAQNGFSEVARALLEAGADRNRDCTDVGATPMFIAAGRGNLEVVRILLEHHADPDKAQIENRATPLLMAASKGHAEVVRLLLEANADQDSDLTAGGVTPLLMACVRGHTEVVRALLDHHAEIDKPCTDDGTTPLNMACGRGHVAAARILLESGADVNKACTDDGATPLLRACERSHLDVIRLLLSFQADANSSLTTSGDFPLYMAAQRGEAEAARLLLLAGADKEKATSRGATPEEAALEGEHNEVLSILAASLAELEHPSRAEPHPKE
ncbi:Ank2 [Symbiodinium sp. CCMP2592]|nr:Ank2 [Symbiodinium sp. CCMP2592]